MIDTKQPFMKLLDEQDRGGVGSRWKTVRESGRRRFRESPFPTPKSEDWRFTSVAPLLQETFAPATTTVVDPSSLPPLSHPDAIRLTFVNGKYVASLSRMRPVPTGVLVGNLADADANLLAGHLARVAEMKEQVFTALNTAAISDGAYVVVPTNVALENPVEILYLTQVADKPIVCHPRTLVVAGKHAQVSVVERYLGLSGDATAFVNAVTEIDLAEGAIIDHVKIQQESPRTYHVANTQIAQARASNFTTHSILLGSRLTRNEVRVRFDGEGAEATVNGLYRAEGTQHLDSHTVIDHAMPHCNSHELYKGVLAGKSHGVFNGKIFVRKDAQKTDAKQTNKVLLLSDDATINTKPQLEIFADDVKCTHGATVGQLDETQTFYLRSRGIGVEEAKRILTFAFANDVVGRLKSESLRDEIEALLMDAD